MMTITEKIDKVLEQLKELASTKEGGEMWFKEVSKTAAKKPTEEEELAYLEGKLQELRNNSEDEADNRDASAKAKLNIWLKIAIGALFLFIIGTMAWFLLLAPKSASATNSSTTAVSSTISKSIDLPKEDFKIMDYVVSGGEIKPNPEMKNQQYKVFANGSSNDSLSDEKDVAIKEMTDYMSHNVSALKEKAMTFGIVSQNTDEKKWLEKRNGSLYYNKEGQDIFYQVKSFLNRSKITSKVMEQGSNYYTTGLNKDNKVVVSQSSQDLSGQHYIEVRNPENSKDQYCYIILVYCGNTVMKNNNIPGVPKEKIEIPKPKKPNEPDKPGKPGKPGKPSEPDKPGKPSEPSKPSESKVEKKAPGKDPANQGKALVGGGQNDGSLNGTETTQASLPEQYSAPSAPVAPSAPASSSAPAQDARISEPSQWSGAGKVTDSNGTTVVADNGAVTTPDNRHYDGLVGQSAPSVESGGNGVTTPSSSANFSGSSMSEPGIDD